MRIFPEAVLGSSSANRMCRGTLKPASRSRSTARSASPSVPAPGTTLDGDELRARQRDRLAAFKVPKYVELADALPKTATGKIRKPELRAAYAAPDPAQHEETTR